MQEINKEIERNEGNEFYRSETEYMSQKRKGLESPVSDKRGTVPVPDFFMSQSSGCMSLIVTKYPVTLLSEK
jgi:hypothetical protein